VSNNANMTEWSLIQSVIIRRVITKSSDQAAGVRFVYQEYVCKRNWTTRSPITNFKIIRITISEQRRIAQLWKNGEMCSTIPIHFNLLYNNIPWAYKTLIAQHWRRVSSYGKWRSYNSSVLLIATYTEPEIEKSIKILLMLKLYLKRGKNRNRLHSCIFVKFSNSMMTVMVLGYLILISRDFLRIYFSVFFP